MSFDISKLDSKVLEEFNSLSESERKIFLKVLDEFSNDGSSNTLIDLYRDDFDEIPVTIEEFLHNPEYLGKGLIGEDGKFTVFPYWVDVLKKVFPNNIQTAYRTLVLSGAIGLGKSFVAVLCILYQLYRMMCLKNPYTFYGLQPIDKITFSFMNITLDASKGVAWDKAQSLLQASPWFMARGTVSGRENIVWTPPKGIELIAGSQPRHVIGRAVFSNFCLDGETKILTTTGIHKICDLVDSEIQVYNFVDNNLYISDLCTVKPTIYTDEEIEIELEDGSIIKCTPEHRFLLKSGEYKEARFLTEEDEIEEYVFKNDTDISYDDYIKNIIKTRSQWGVPDSEYFESHHIIPKCLGGLGNIYYRRNRTKHENIIYLYPQEHYIAHKLLALENPDRTSLLNAWHMMAFPKGKTNRNIEISPNDYAKLRHDWSSKMHKNNNWLDKDGHPWNYGLTNIYSKESRLKMGPSGQHWQLSDETRKKMLEAAKKRDYSKLISPNIDKIVITNGIDVRFIKKDDTIPEHWYRGNCKTAGKHNMSNFTSDMRKARSDRVKGKLNPMYGSGYKISKGKNGRSIYNYYIDGKAFDCRIDLLDYLKIEFPDISDSTIRKIVNGNFGIRTVNKYQYVIDNLYWELKKDENKIY